MLCLEAILNGCSSGRRDRGIPQCNERLSGVPACVHRED